MLQNIKTLHGRKLAAQDGEIGKVADFYFDDKTWAIRYLVAHTGGWLTDRLVLISPHSLGQPDADAKSLRINLSRRQIENSPTIAADKPVSRQNEIDYYRYYGWPTYWNGDGLWGATSYPAILPFSTAKREAAQHDHDNDDPHLRSVKAVTGYALHATDGEIGSICGFMMDDKTWAIGNLIAETGHWYAGKEILIPTAQVAYISHEDSEVHVNLTLADLKATGENEVAIAGGSTSAVKYRTS